MEGSTGVLTNSAYIGFPRNDGFKMMPDEIEAWASGDRTVTYRGKTGYGYG
jgi:hypothetical protein